MNSFLGKVLFLMNRVTKFLTITVLLTQRLWWRKRMGGLIELYAVKVEE